MLLYSPVESACGPLESLYLEFIERVKAQLLANAPLARSLFVQIGALMMIVSANDTPIPWVLKGRFALKMLDATRRGYAAGYIVSMSFKDKVHLSLPSSLSSPATLGHRNSQQPLRTANANDDLKSEDELSETEGDIVMPCNWQCPGPART